MFFGIGDVVVNRFFVVLNLFSIDLKILKKWEIEREVGIVVEEVVYFLCYDVIEYEKVGIFIWNMKYNIFNWKY